MRRLVDVAILCAVAPGLCLLVATGVAIDIVLSTLPPKPVSLPPWLVSDLSADEGLLRTAFAQVAA